MKTIVFLITGLLFGITPVAAEQKSASQGEDLIRTQLNNDVFTFVERGIEFIIFPDGSFDFNTELNTTNGDVYYRRSKATKINTTFGAPGTINIDRNRFRNTGVIITHDREGKVRRIGNVFLNYTRDRKIKRIGSVYLNYNRRGLVNRIGGLRIKYNRFGEIINTRGQIKRTFRNGYNASYYGNATNNDPLDNTLYYKNKKRKK